MEEYRRVGIIHAHLGSKQKAGGFMDKPSKHHITKLLLAWSKGEQAAFDELLPLVEQELRRLAQQYMRKEGPGHLLQTTALINEAYLRLVEREKVQWQNRAHFLGTAAQVMRNILVDIARERGAAKRGGDMRFVPLEEAATVSLRGAVESFALDEALTALAEDYPRQARVVELRHFGGLSVAETAEVLQISKDTVMRDWQFGLAWLRRCLSAEKGR